MKDEENDKQVWQTPEVIDLDVTIDTEKAIHSSETGAFGAS